MACGAAPSPAPAGQTPPALRRCVGTPFTPAPTEAWVHPTLTPVTTLAFGAANHSMQDVLATSAGAATIHGKFTYGSVSKDLEDEKVRVLVDTCSGWTSLGDFRTDTDGRIAAPVPPLAAGVYDVRLQVLGDATVAPGRIWILPAGTHLAVTDIDGTLTTSDEELVTDVITDFFQPIYTGADVPAAYPGAATLTNALVGRGHVLVFLTGRPYWLTGKTREWLGAGGFALGPLHVTDSNSEAIPSQDGVGAFKLAYLRSLKAAGFLLDEAYGNATTDVYAYGGAPIPAAATWIIGPHAGSGGTQAVTGSWEPRAAAVSALPPVTQPFTVPGG